MVPAGRKKNKIASGKQQQQQQKNVVHLPNFTFKYTNY